jgi:hypothetical protein
VIRFADFKIRRVLVRARLTKGSDNRRQICSYAPSYDLPDPILYTCGSAIPAAVSVNKELFCGTADGIQALVCTFGMPVVCKTSNRRGNAPPATYARAHGPGLIPLAPPRGADHAVGHAKLQRRWALDFLVLPLLPVCRCPARAVPARGHPGEGGGRGAGLDWAFPGLPPSGAPSWGHIRAASTPKSCLLGLPQA